MKLGHFISLWVAAGVILPACLLAATPGLAEALEKLRSVGPKGEGHEEAVRAWPVAAQASAEELTTVLAAMEGANPLTENWIRAAAETIAQRAIAQGKLPNDALERFLLDTKHSPRGRRLAYELVASVDESAEQRLIPGLIDDPSLELRRDAIALAIADAEKALSAGDKNQGLARYRQAFAASRDVDQVRTTADKLKSLGEEIDLPRHYGFVMSWKLIGPFDNTGAKGFDVAYAPETEAFRANAVYEGKSGKVSWKAHTTTDEHGMVDLNQAIAKEKGVVAYAYAEFHVDKATPAEVRLGSLNANKIWVNGELASANNVYHSGIDINQYIGNIQLKPGKNTILVKSCQNEQTDSWAEGWGFQLRVCDEIGTPIVREKFQIPNSKDQGNSKDRKTNDP